MERDATLHEAERWFVRHGLPYFVDDERATVRRGLERGRLLPVLTLAVVVAAAVGVLLGLLMHDVSGGLALGLLVLAAVLAVYAGTTLRVRVIAAWAARHTLRTLPQLFPLVTRALPLLLLFVTFLFINTEVWMVANSLDPAVLTMAVMFFAAIAVGFLLVQLPAEMDRVDDDTDPGRLSRRTAGTPVASCADEVFGGADPNELVEVVEVSGLQKWNLVLVLLVAQALQVLLLSGAVLLFFLVFGQVVMQPDVVNSWLGLEGPDELSRVTAPLLKVSVFLAGFSGLYFTVYAVTDETYRSQFFTAVTRELERAVAVRAVYQTLRRTATTD
ncbi:MAG: hypothetical protein HOQ22_03735 [Nocardioidaceae bacterium]|nr:hypothetical protein [Nocardioidaceae bacterium]